MSDPIATGPQVTLPVQNGALPAEDPAGEVVAAIAQAQTISPGILSPIVISRPPLLHPESSPLCRCWFIYSPRSRCLTHRRPVSHVFPHMTLPHESYPCTC